MTIGALREPRAVLEVGPRGVIEVASVALAVQAAELPTLVAIVTRHNPVSAGEKTADCTMIEARWRKRPLCVALSTARRQSVGVDAVVAVAVDTQVAGSTQAPRIDVARGARSSVVSAAQRESPLGCFSLRGET